jgi:hypothetical protein
VLHRHADRAVGIEGDLAGEHLVEHHAQGVEVALGADPIPHGLLGGHVLRRAEHEAAVRERGLGGGPGYAEVRHLGVPGGGEQDVVGLDVPVDDARLVGDAEGLGDLRPCADRLGGVQGAPL